MTKQESPVTSDATALSDFMNSLQRLFRIGIYYPSGHIILDQATERFMRLLVELADESHSVMIQTRGNTLILQGIKLDPNMTFVQELNSMLSTLGITTIVIDRQISLAELHDFVRKLLSHKAKALNAKHFTQVEITDLPHSITAEQKEFLARSDATIKRDDTIGDLDSFVDSLSRYGLDDSEIKQCRTLLDALPNQLARSSIEMSDLPYASWDDVASLLSRVIRGGREVKSSKSSQSNINALASILKKLEMETTDRKSREAINLLVSIIKKPLQESGDADEREIPQRVFPPQPTVSLDKIQNYIDEKKLNPKILQKIPESYADTETLSILMQLSRYEQSLPNQIRMQQLFRELLAGKLSDKAWEILSHGLHEVIQDGKSSRISTTVRILLEPLRRSVHSNTLLLFQRTAKLCNPDKYTLFWPFIVNEILVVGSSNDKLIYHELCQNAARMTHEQMVTFLPQLRVLDAFQETKIASDIFHAVSPSCYPLFAFLFKTDIGRYVGERVIGGLKRNPQDWLIKAVVPLLDLTLQDHKLFLYSYLRQAAQKVISESLRNIAAKIVTAELPQLAEERRNEQWIEHTITSMAQLPGESIRQLLQQIASGKKLLFLHEWPVQCRKAAETALSQRK